MKNLILTFLATLLIIPGAFGQQEEEKEKKEKGVVIEEGDSTVMQFGDTRIVINEVDDENVNVRIKTKDGTKVISTKKGRVNISEEGHVEINEENEDYEGEARVEIDTDEEELDNVDTRYLMLDLGINGYFNSQDEIAPPAGYEELALNYGKSINVNLHLLRQRLNLIRHHVNLKYGLSFEFNNYRFDQDITLAPDMDVVTPVPTEDPVKKSKLTNTYLYVPVMLNFESNPQETKRSFRVNAGVFGGVLIGSHTKVKTENGKKLKVRDDFNLNSFRYGLTGQIGYGWFNIYANYSLSNMFNEGEGPIATPFNVGITLIGF